MQNHVLFGPKHSEWFLQTSLFRQSSTPDFLLGEPTMIMMLLADLDRALTKWLLHLVGPDSSRHCLVVMNDDESDRLHDNQTASLSIHVVESTCECHPGESRRRDLSLLSAFTCRRI
jgi:hypothetical protein